MCKNLSALIFLQLFSTPHIFYDRGEQKNQKTKKTEKTGKTIIEKTEP
jgi:hypothetical protein